MIWDLNRTAGTLSRFAVGVSTSLGLDECWCFLSTWCPVLYRKYRYQNECAVLHRSSEHSRVQYLAQENHGNLLEMAWHLLLVSPESGETQES